MDIAVKLIDLKKSQEALSERHFGLNHIFEFEKFGDRGWQTFDEIVAQTSPGILRYPGGSSTETLFDMSDPEKIVALDGKGIARTLTPLSSFLRFCDDVDAKAMITIPISQLLTDGHYGWRNFNQSQEEVLRSYIAYALQTAGPNVIGSFELGNEYEGRMSSREYGRVSSAAALIIQQEIDKFHGQHNSNAFKEPSIIAQVWSQCANGGISYDGLEHRNAEVLAQFDEKELAAIDGLVSHYYYRPGHDIGLSTENSLKNLDRSIDLSVRLMRTWETAAGRDLSFAFSEWNAQQNVAANFGAKQAASVIGMLAAFLRSGADELVFWSSQYHSTSLATTGGRLQIAGKILQLLEDMAMGSNVVGRAIVTADLTVNLFEKNGKLTAVVCSTSDKSQSVHVDFEASGLDLLGVERLVVNGAKTDAVYNGSLVSSIYEDPDAYLDVLTSSDASISATGLLGATLLPYEVAFYQISLPEGVTIPFEETTLLGVGDSAYSKYLIGSNSSELIVGSKGRDRIEGGCGSDTLRGSLSDDSLSGGSGNDSLIGGSGNDHLDGGRGIDTTVFTSANRIVVNLDLVGAQNTGDGSDTLRSIENVTSGSGNDRLTGNGLTNALRGGEGNDILLGKGGSDSVYGGSGSDKLYGGDGNDFLFGGQGNDLLSGGDGVDTIVFTSSRDAILALNDTRAQMSGQGQDRLKEIENVLSGAGNDRISGSGVANRLSGAGGNDTLFGAGGNDTLLGGQGRDKLTGGNGADQFVFNTCPNSKGNTDQITDFDSSTDKIVFDHKVFKALMSMLKDGQNGLVTSQFFIGSYAQNADEHLIYERTSGRLFYDADGDGEHPQTLLATLSGHPILLDKDIFIL